jgi:hypothetical protein
MRNEREHPHMDRRLLPVALGSCVLLVLLGTIVLLGTWFAAGSTVVPPGAGDIQIQQLSLTQQRLAYRLPLGWTWNDLHRYLTDHGWLVDEEVARAQQHERMGAKDAFAVFWAESRFGLVPESVTVRRDPTDRQVIAVQIFRCFRSASWGGCL